MLQENTNASKLKERLRSPMNKSNTAEEPKMFHLYSNNASAKVNNNIITECNSVENPNRSFNSSAQTCNKYTAT